MRVLQFVSRLFVGLIFIFSGFVKAVDPMGSTFKFTDYFLAFGTDALKEIAFPLAILLSTLEFTLGMALIFNSRKNITAWLALLFMLFFTPLTFILAIQNPVTDCGCFGDALVLSNWETFWKNIVILAFTLVIFLRRKKDENQHPIWEQNLLIGFALIVSVWISTYSYRHLPLIDFRPYHIGANISDGMRIPEGAPADEYRSLFKYQKDGVVKEFDETNYPWQDTSWKYVDSEQIKIKEGYTPPIHDFSISNETEGDITNMVLSDNGYTFLLVSKNLSEINESALLKIKELAFYALGNNIQFIGLTASGEDVMQGFKTTNELPFDFYNTDEIQLKTIIRSNPGLVLLKKGTILDKWHFRDFPGTNQLQGDLAAYSITKHQTLNINLFIISITSTLLLLLVLFSLIRIRLAEAKNRLRL
ncbi:BT_3928 family protein [Labilibaculum sp.]|uniref:BT_3928 family protein n=1 Tax=Labilibaculum sp. TaxID=2060723 RepID=UPI002AA89CA8|nr:BT_3928 family protein [Labilibaculum sp.]MBN2598635.1 DoxX family protein [Marinifilaceae bacterium]